MFTGTVSNNVNTGEFWYQELPDFFPIVLIKEIEGYFQVHEVGDRFHLCSKRTQEQYIATLNTPSNASVTFKSLGYHTFSNLLDSSFVCGWAESVTYIDLRPYGDEIENNDVEKLPKKFISCTHLFISSKKVSEVSLSSLANLNSLKQLNLEGCNLSEDAEHYEWIQQIKSLKHLNLAKKHLTKTPDLKRKCDEEMGCRLSSGKRALKFSKTESEEEKVS